MGGIGGKDKRDIYYRAAKEFGFRARSAFKLLQINEQFHIFHNHHVKSNQHIEQHNHNHIHKGKGNENQNESVSRENEGGSDEDPDGSIGGATQTPAPMMSGSSSSSSSSSAISGNRKLRIVDLCAAPGAWSEVCRLLTPSDTQIIAVDLQSMNPIPGVEFIKGDITRQSTVNQIMRQMNHQYANIVLADGAPDVTGIHSVDQYIQHRLLLSSINIARAILQHNEFSIFIGKIFRGNRCSQIFAYLLTQFNDVTLCKPRASRNASIEGFIVCRGYKHDPTTVDINQPIIISEQITMNHDEDDDAEEISAVNVKFLSCGGGFQYLKGADLKQCEKLDSDKTYPLSYTLRMKHNSNSSSSSSSDADAEADCDGINTNMNVSVRKAVIQNQPIDAPYRVALAMKRSNRL